LRAYSTQLPVILRGVLLENNTALVGGGISVHSVLSLILDEYKGDPTRIVNNAAVLGGGLYRQRGTLTYEQMHVSQNLLLALLVCSCWICRFEILSSEATELLVWEIHP